MATVPLYCPALLPLREEAVSEALSATYDTFEQWVKRLWPNEHSVENHRPRSDTYWDEFDYIFTSPGFLEMIR